MIRFQTRLDSTPRKSTASGRASSATSTKSGVSFSELLAVEDSTRKSENELDLLKKNFEESERRFAASPDLSAFEEYRKNLRALTEYLLSRSFVTKTYSGKNQSEVRVVHEIDQKLAEMYRTLLRRRPDIALSLRWMGEIRGLLVNILS